jgi:hypothetical protein
MNIRRFIIVAFSATLVSAGLFFLVVLCFPDVTPLTTFEKIWTCVWAVFSWPIIIAALLFREDPPLIVCILLWIVTGLFWAFIVELLFKFVGRRKSKTSN